MSDKKNLSPWQEKNLEYQKKKLEEEREKNPKENKLLRLHKKKDSEEKKSSKESELNEDEKSEQETAVEVDIPQKVTADDKSSEESAHDEEFSEEEIDEAEEAFNHFKSQNQAFNKEKTADKEKKKKPIFPRHVLKKMWIALTIALLVFLGSAYEVSPISKISGFTVSGNLHEKAEDVAKASKLKTGDTVFQIIKNKASIQNRIVSQFPRVASVNLKFHFPNKFEAIVTEYQDAVYVEQSKKTYEVLENGYIVKEVALNANQLKKLPILKDFTDAEVKTFVEAYIKLSKDLKSKIGTVTKTPTTATKDFIAIDMTDGNQVRVPLSQMANKLPYYPSVAKQIQTPQVVDMEAGIYAKSKTDYDKDLSSISESKSISMSESKAKADASKSSTEASSTGN